MPPAPWPPPLLPPQVRLRQARRRIARRSASPPRLHGRKRRNSKPAARRIAGKTGFRRESRCCSSGRLWFLPCRTMSRGGSGHNAVTRYSHNPSVPGGGIRPGADSGHEEPVTPDERAPFIRGRFVVPSMPCPRLVYPQTQRRPGHFRAFAVCGFAAGSNRKTQAKGPGFLPGLRMSRRLTCTRKSRLRNPSRRQSKSAVADLDHFKKRVAA